MGRAFFKLCGTIALEVVGFAALGASFLCAFVTFATSDYRPILAAGFGFVALAKACYGLLFWRGGEGRSLYLLPLGISAVALTELLLRL